MEVGCKNFTVVLFSFLYLGFHSQVPSRHLPAQRAAIETLEKGVKYVQN